MFLCLLFAASGESRAADDDDPCPNGWHYERTRIFHAGPKPRLVGNKSRNGRVCVDLRRPHPNDPALQYNDGCPPGWAHERVGILHDAPKDRVVGGSYHKSPG